MTNPPFSLFREFMAWITEAGKSFLVIGNMNAITYKEIFPLIKEGKLWMGPSIHSGDREFGVPNDYPLTASGYRIDEHDRKFIRVKGVRWFTNLEHGRRHKPMQLMTMQDNIRFSHHKEVKGKGYSRYDNYDAIEVPYTDAIPGDYDGVMGVPISFLDRYCPEQFEILGCTEGEGKGFSNGLWDSKRAVSQPIVGRAEFTRGYLSKLRIPGCDKYDRPYVNGRRLYFRILIKQKLLPHL